MELPITDDHMHIDPLKGEGILAAKKFARAGGKNLFLVSKLTRDLGLEPKSEAEFSKMFDKTIELAGEVKREVGINAYVVIGVHPAEVAWMCEQFSAEKAVEIACRALDIAGGLISDGEAVAMGEVGRPHYEVSESVMDASMKVLSYALGVASELDCAVQLHTESIGAEGFDEFRELAVANKLEPERVVKHFSPPFVEAAERSGIFPSIIASEENIRKALEQGTRFMMESDYIDDLRRPGAVVGPKSVPRVTLKLLRDGTLTEDDVHKIHVENVEAVYGIEL